MSNPIDYQPLYDKFSSATQKCQQITEPYIKDYNHCITPVEGLKESQLTPEQRDTFRACLERVESKHGGALAEGETCQASLNAETDSLLYKFFHAVDIYTNVERTGGVVTGIKSGVDLHRVTAEELNQIDFNGNGRLDDEEIYELKDRLNAIAKEHNTYCLARGYTYCSFPTMIEPDRSLAVAVINYLEINNPQLLAEAFPNEKKYEKKWMCSNDGFCGWVAEPFDEDKDVGAILIGDNGATRYIPIEDLRSDEDKFVMLDQYDAPSVTTQTIPLPWKRNFGGSFPTEITIREIREK